MAKPESPSLHRSFRLTGDLEVERPTRAGSLRDAFYFSVVQQGIFLLFTALLLDGGVLFRVCGVGSIAYWVGAVIVVVRRPRNPTAKDVILLKYGFPLAVAVVMIVQAVFTLAGILTG